MESPSERDSFSDPFFNNTEAQMEKMREKNRQIQKLLDEMNDMEAEKKEMGHQIVRLKNQLSDATDQLNRSAADMKILHNRIIEVQTMNRQVVKENESLLKEIGDLTSTIDNLRSQDEVMAKEFTAQVDRVIAVMNEKDEEIKRLNEKLKGALPEIREGDQEETESYREKDVSQLKDQLQQATQTIEYQTTLIQQLQKALTDEKYQGRTSATDDDQFLYQQLEEAELELGKKDDLIIQLNTRIRDYEDSHYGLSDAMRDLENAKNTIARKDKQITDLTSQLNEMSLEFNDCQDELEYIRECVSGKSGIDLDNLPTNQTTEERRRDKLKVLRLQQQLVQLEDEKIDIEEQLRGLKHKLVSLKSTETNQQLMTKVAELEAQNRDLKLGMKEILIGIQQTDGQSDVAVECPTLDRLCRFFESQAISEPLSSIISLKAELDLMRGYNEQLREQLKQTRCEHLKILALYADEVMADTLEKQESFDFDQDSEMQGDETYSEGQIPSQIDDDIESDVPIREQDIRPSAPPLFPPEDFLERPISPQPPPIPPRVTRIPSIQVEEAHDGGTLFVSGHTEKEDASTQTDTAEFVRSEDAQQQLSHREQPPQHSSSSVITIKRCARCSRLLRVLNDVKTRLAKTEKSIRISEDASSDRIKQIQVEHASFVASLEEQVRQLKEEIRRKDIIIETNKTRPTSSVQRRSAFIASPVEVLSTSPQPTSHVVDMAVVPLLQLTGTSDSSGIEMTTASTGKEKYMEIIESVIKCLQERLDRKNETIKGYEKLLDETKENFEQQILSVLDQQQVTQDESREFIMKVVSDNEELEGVLHKCMKELQELKEEAKGKISSLEQQVQQEKDMVSHLQAENDQLKKKQSPLATPAISLRNEINQLKDELKAKESTIAQLTKSLKEERLQRLGTTQTSVSGSHTTSTTATVKKATTAESADIADIQRQLEKLKQEVDEKKRQLRDCELHRWEAEKKAKENLLNALQKLKEQQQENEKLNDYIARREKIWGKMEKDKEKRRKSISSAHEETSTPASSASLPMKTEGRRPSISRADKQTQVSVITSEDRHDVKDSRRREEELRILLEESLQREKMAALRATAAECPELSPDALLLQENATLKVELRMTEFELKKSQQQQHPSRHTQQSQTLTVPVTQGKVKK